MYKKAKYAKGMLFYPTFVLNDLVVIFVFMAIFSTVVFLYPDMLQSGDANIPADPFNTPEHIKPEWYFLAPYQLLKLVPELVALALQTLALLIFMFLPFIDRSQESNIWKRPLFLITVISFTIIYAGLTLWGARS
jgi:ubiquinol-cytochrome c reductase cytochrome b subunit